MKSDIIHSLRNIILVDNSSDRVDISSLRATISFTDVMESTKSQESLVADSLLDPNDIINIQFTSGTTSSPKAACLTHRSILNNGYFIGARQGLTPNDVVCCPPPLFHCFGCILGYMATATHGSAILFASEAFNPKAVLASIKEHHATALYGVATMFVAELELLANGSVPYEDFEHLRTGIAAGSSVPSSLMEKLHKMLNLTGLTICYGMTETSPVSAMTTPTDPIEKRVNSVGRLLPHVEAKVVASDDRTRILPLGEKGELAVSGYLVMKEYWNDAERTQEVRTTEPMFDEQGRKIGSKTWMYTGDEAEMDEEGYIRITGRLKDLIIRGGENIHPLEVENVLFRHECVSEVSVVGLPDEKYGECVAAFIVPHGNVKLGEDDAGNGGTDERLRKASGKSLTRQEVKDWVKTRLSNHLVPRYVFWVKEYPKTASGKIQKFKLRELGINWLAE